MVSRAANTPTQYVCTACGLEFYLRRKTTKPEPLCSSCLYKEAKGRAITARYWERDEYKQKAKEWRLKHYYNLTSDELSLIKEQQGGVCAICCKEDMLVVDHDHETGEVRGLLCQKCNRALGSFGDKLPSLRRCIDYLMRHRMNWDDYFIEFARLAATRSKDPSSQIGAVLVRDRILISTGYNGFPRQIDDEYTDRYSRPEKYKLIVHAEENAILNASRVGLATQGATLYLYAFGPIAVPCTECSKSVIQAGITKIVGFAQKEMPTWATDLAFAQAMLLEAGVELEEMK